MHADPDNAVGVLGDGVGGRADLEQSDADGAAGRSAASAKAALALLGGVFAVISASSVGVPGLTDPPPRATGLAGPAARSGNRRRSLKSSPRLGSGDSVSRSEKQRLVHGASGSDRVARRSPAGLRSPRGSGPPKGDQGQLSPDRPPFRARKTWVTPRGPFDRAGVEGGEVGVEFVGAGPSSRLALVVLVATRRAMP